MTTINDIARRRHIKLAKLRLVADIVDADPHAHLPEAEVDRIVGLLESTDNGETFVPHGDYVYRSKDGETFVGTLPNIGDALIVGSYDNDGTKHYGLGIRGFQDNREPWLKWGEDEGDEDTEYPREFTLFEWVEWVASAEDRHEGHVMDDLQQLADANQSRMGPTIIDTDPDRQRALERRSARLLNEFEEGYELDLIEGLEEEEVEE